MSCSSGTLARRWFEEVWNQRRTETIDELVGPESVCFTDDGPVRGPDEFRNRMFAPFVDAFPDLKVTVEAVLEQGDDVVIRWTATGAHRGAGLGFKATNEPAEFRGITWVKIRDGRMAEGWQSSNIPDVVKGLAARAPV